MRLVALLLVGIGVGLLLVQGLQAHEREDRLGAIASESAGREVAVRCQGRIGAAFDATAEDGSVPFDSRGRPAGYTNLKRRVCAALDAFAADPTDATERELNALDTIAHEAWHLAGIRSESEAQCRALQTIALVARRLGADDIVAQSLADRFERDVQPRLRAEYRTAECRDGGPLDLRPADPVWP